MTPAVPAKFAKFHPSLVRLEAALLSLPAIPVFRPCFHQMLGAPGSELVSYTGVTKSDLGKQPLQVVAVGAFGVPPSPIATFSLN